MIVNLILNLIVLIFGSIFSWLPAVTTIPNIAGYDIDGALVTGMGQLQSFMVTFWPIQYMFYGSLFIMGYFIIKMGVTFILGHRAPK